LAVVVAKESEFERGTDQLQNEFVQILKERIAGFKVPKRVYIQAQLPRNVMGKVQKNVLRERYQHIFEN